MEVASALATFADTHPAMRSLGCDRESLHDRTAANRNAAELARFPLSPDLVQCGTLAVAELPSAASFGPVPFVLLACAGSTSATTTAVPTIGGDNWIIWPWYAARDWMADDLADELTRYLGLSLTGNPYTFSSTGAAAGNGRTTPCYSLRGFVPPGVAPKTN